MTDAGQGGRSAWNDDSAMPGQNLEVTVGMEAGHTSGAVGPAGDPIEKQTSLRSEAFRELRRNPMFVVSAGVVLVMIFIAIFPQLLAPVRPVFQACHLSDARKPPEAGAPFGYDSQGCDVFDGVIWGARPSISIGLLTSLGIVVIGVFFGSLAGFYGGWIDASISRVTDVMFGFPFLVGAIVILTAFPHRNLWTVTLVLVVFGWASLTRIMRSSVFSARSMDYVQAARALGATNSRIMFRHILPNAITPVLVLATVGVGAIIGAEATLTFLGVGLQAPANSWGLSISQAQNRVTQAPHMLLFPGIFLSITVLAFIVMGDAVRDAFDPKLR
jgi:oligopeptide transport system permease protein